MTASHNLRAYLLLIITTWCWGLNAIISRLAVGEISPMQLVTFRWLGVVLILAIIARDNIARDWPILRRHLPFLCLMGSCGFTAFNALFYVAGHHTSAINMNRSPRFTEVASSSPRSPLEATITTPSSVTATPAPWMTLMG